MSDTGPVCHIPPANTPGRPQPNDLPGLPGPATPNDLSSIVDLLNAMRQMLLQLAGQQNNRGQQINQQINNAFSRSPANSRWAEVSRTTQKVKVYQNNDPTTGNFVEVEQINRLTMGDKKTKETWVWDRDRGGK